MKKMFAFLFFLSLLVGCKKSNEGSSPILGRWSLRPTIFDMYTNGSISSTSDQNHPVSDYIEFKNNGKAESETTGTPFTYSYFLENDNLIFDNVRKAKVTQLTSNILKYYFKDSINPTQYRISTFSLYK